MLARCLPDATVRLTTHSRLVQQGKRRVILPKHREIEAGYVRDLIRQFEVDPDAAADYIPFLKHK